MFIKFVGFLWSIAYGNLVRFGLRKHHRVISHFQVTNWPRIEIFLVRHDQNVIYFQGLWLGSCLKYFSVIGWYRAFDHGSSWLEYFCMDTIEFRREVKFEGCLVRWGLSSECLRKLKIGFPACDWLSTDDALELLLVVVGKQATELRRWGLGFGSKERKLGMNRIAPFFGSSLFFWLSTGMNWVSVTNWSLFKPLLKFSLILSVTTMELTVFWWFWYSSAGAVLFVLEELIIFMVWKLLLLALIISEEALFRDSKQFSWTSSLEWFWPQVCSVFAWFIFIIEVSISRPVIGQWETILPSDRLISTQLTTSSLFWNKNPPCWNLLTCSLRCD